MTNDTSKSVTKYLRNPQYITNHISKSTHYSKFTSAIHKNESATANGNWDPDSALAGDGPTCDPSDAPAGDASTCDTGDPPTWFDDAPECR
jgi:hypothetical protein